MRLQPPPAMFSPGVHAGSADKMGAPPRVNAEAKHGKAPLTDETFPLESLTTGILESSPAPLQEPCHP